MQVMQRSPGGSTHLDSTAINPSPSLERLSSQQEGSGTVQLFMAQHPIHSCHAHAHGACMPPPAPLSSTRSSLLTSTTTGLLGSTLFPCAVGVPMHADLHATASVTSGQDTHASVSHGLQVQPSQVLSQLLAMVGAEAGGSVGGAAASVQCRGVCVGTPVDPNLAALASAAAPGGQFASDCSVPQERATSAAAAALVATYTGSEGACMGALKAAGQGQGENGATASVNACAAQGGMYSMSSGSDALELGLPEMQSRIEEVMHALQTIGSVRRSTGVTYLKLWACMGEDRQRQAYDILRSSLLSVQLQEAVRHVHVVLAHNVSSVGPEALLEAVQQHPI